MALFVGKCILPRRLRNSSPDYSNRTSPKLSLLVDDGAGGQRPRQELAIVSGKLAAAAAEFLEEFVPASQRHLVVEAIKRAFDQHGSRKDRHKVRLRFLVERVGLEAFRELYREQLDQPVRATQSQNLALRWVREDELPALHARLLRLGLADSQPLVLQHLVACTGASTCRLGICLSRELATAIVSTLSRSGLDLDRLGPLRVNISGCPNSCGRHPLGQVGLAGAVRRVNGRLAPHYTVLLGGHLEEGKTSLAAVKGTIPAGTVPAFIERLLAAWLQSDQRHDWSAFLEAQGEQFAWEPLAPY